MSGAKAPTFWRNGEFEAVKTYLRGDVIQPLKLTFAIENNHGIKWTSKTGRSQFLSTNLITVKNCLKLPEPNTSWMTNPKQRNEYYSWIPKNILDKEL